MLRWPFLQSGGFGFGLGVVATVVVAGAVVAVEGGVPSAYVNVPPLPGASSALTACLVVYSLKAFVALAPYARLALRPVKP